MKNREEYVQKVKSQLDQWNTEVARWEAEAKKVQGKLQQEYSLQLDQLRKKRDEALAEMHRVQGASADAWQQLMTGSDLAFKAMQEAVERARKAFEKR